MHWKNKRFGLISKMYTIICLISVHLEYDVYFRNSYDCFVKLNYQFMWSGFMEYSFYPMTLTSLLYFNNIKFRSYQKSWTEIYWKILKRITYDSCPPTIQSTLWRQLFFFFFFFFFCPFRAAPTAYGSSLARGGIGAATAGLHHSFGNTGSRPCLWHTPQLMATPDPRPTEQGQGSNPCVHGS